MALNEAFDEMRGLGETIREAYRSYNEWLDETPISRLTERHQQADLIFRRLGITFSVYGSDEGVERLIPFDVVPRILDAAEWDTLAGGVIQRVRAINAFLNDIYHEQNIFEVRQDSGGPRAPQSRVPSRGSRPRSAEECVCPCGRHRYR